MTMSLTIYADTYSGHCEKVKFLADHLGIAYRWVHTDIRKKETQAPAFLAINPAGEVPVLELADGRTLAQSNAILLYLAEGSALIPADALDRGLMHQWLFWEQVTHGPAVGFLRFQRFLLKMPENTIDPALVVRAERALATLDAHLHDRRYVAGERLSVADVALVAYSRLADEGGMALTQWPSLRAWVQRVEQDLRIPTALPAI